MDNMEYPQAASPQNTSHPPKIIKRDDIFKKRRMSRERQNSLQNESESIASTLYMPKKGGRHIK